MERKLVTILFAAATMAAAVQAWGGTVEKFIGTRKLLA